MTDDDQKKVVPIDYTHRSYESIRRDLLGIAERLYPATFQDWSEASFGSLMIDAVSYVGDQLSFYLDYNTNETFLDTAYQYDNILRLGRSLGYKYRGRPSTFGPVAFFVKVPASSTGIGPDTSYIPILKRGTKVGTSGGLGFILTENIDFGNPRNSTVVATTDTSTGAPTSFAIKAYGNVVSGRFGQEQITVGAYTSFLKVSLSSANISEIVSVVDAAGNEYYEVDYLAQDMVYEEIPNNNFRQDNVPSVIKPLLVSRKFVLIQDRNSAALQFGSGDYNSTNVVAQPQSVAADVFGKSYVTDMTFDPTRVSKNQNFGVVPQNTTLTVTYRATNPTNSNVSVGGLNAVSSVNAEFKNRNQLTTAKINDVIASLEVTNEVPITGDVSNLTSGELKRQVYDTFPTQNRAVTQADYENLTYRMAAKYGSIARCSVQRDPNSLKRNLNMYVISEDKFGLLTTTNSTIKNNLKTWLNNYRMLNDTIDILDAYIINLGIEFIIKAAVGVDKYSLLDSAIGALRRYFSTRLFIGEHFSISNVYGELKKVPGLLDVTNVKITNKAGNQYATTEFDIDSNISPEGTYLTCPKNAIFEIKFPGVDIKGKIR